MNLWRMIRGMIGHKPLPSTDPAVKEVREDAEKRASETHSLVAQIRTAERRRLAIARRNYEERLYGTFHR